MIEYRLGGGPAARRAWSLAAVSAATGLVPLLMAVELLRRLGWTLPATFWVVAGAMAIWVVTRACVQGSTARRRLSALQIVLDEGSIAARMAGESRTIVRADVARIVEVDGALGGMRVESVADPATGTTTVSVPRGGEGFGALRAGLERWRAIERRGRRGPVVRVLLGVAVVAAIFFLPFALDDVVARSRLTAASIIVVAWAVLRWTMRGR